MFGESLLSGVLKEVDLTLLHLLLLYSQKLVFFLINRV